jgi:hypothetical protein
MRQILKQIVGCYPDVEFIISVTFVELLTALSN